MADQRVNRNDVLAAIYSKQNCRRIVWTPHITLVVMGIERYPHDPPDNLRRMKRILKSLCDKGLLVQRPLLQSNYTLKEVAYERSEL